MAFIRDEATRALSRWREALVGGGAAAVGVWLMMTAYGALLVIGTALAVGGALLAVAGVQRARFRQGREGPGVVQLDEGQVAYFGPVDGGAVGIPEIRRLSIGGGDRPVWRIEAAGGEVLDVPLGAVGADRLFDAFAQLPGISTARLTAAAAAPPEDPRVVWEDPKGRPAISAH